MNELSIVLMNISLGTYLFLLINYYDSTQKCSREIAEDGSCILTFFSSSFANIIFFLENAS